MDFVTVGVTSRENGVNVKSQYVSVKSLWPFLIPSVASYDK